MQVKCTSCGALQNITDAQNCSYCGSLIEIESAKSNYQKAMQSESGNLMAMAETAIEATNWEEALQFFNRVLEKDITNSDAWLGKGIAIVYTSKIGDLKINEAIAYWKNALKHSSNQEAMGKRVAKEINEVVNKFYPSLENHFIQFKDLDNSYQELVGKFAILEKAQDYATQLDSNNLTIYETGYALCKRVIQIPQKYAIDDLGSAWAGVLIGTVQNNKYKTQDAVKKGQKARERKNEIKNAAKIVFKIEEKYVNNILKLNPSYNILSSNSLNSLNEKKAADEAKKRAPSVVLVIVMVFFGIIFSWLASIVGIALNYSGIYLGENKELFFTIFTIIGAIIGYRFAKNKIINPKKKPKKKEESENKENNNNQVSTISKSNRKNVFISVSVLLVLIITAFYFISSNNKENVTEEIESDKASDEITFTLPSKNNETPEEKAAKEQMRLDSLQNDSKIREEYESANKQAKADSLAKTGMASNNNSSSEIPSEGIATAISNRAYFYEAPDASTKRKAFIIEGQEVKYSIVQDVFIFCVFKNDQGKETQGWMLKSDFKFK